ncbi:protein lethal(2)denticleless [Bactrocera neohumeralis]|uniref:protein lethal(2)denticleless n=1 Tax=Bactrocera neohumeralis TaxID=98809 RepID=UPI002166965A|nr:protein lethal(2)denticleless [Bactrocera neohumeralis]
MNIIHKFFNRQQGITTDYTYDFALRRLCVAKEDSWRGILPSNYSSDYNPEPPIFSAKFSKCNNFRHILAIANEDGKIALQDTTKKNEEPEERSLNAPQCHYNAVFDLEWAPGEMKFVSASGDHTASLWQVDEQGEIRNIRSFVGHTRSVKTAAFRRHDSSVFATGGRDGAIIIWDTRANLNVDLTPRADNCIYSGHVGGPGTPVSHRKRTRTPKMTPSATSSSITGLAFQDENTLISCGAGDGIIKVWDLRRNYTAYKKEPHPKHSLPYAGSSTFKGFTNLLVDESGSRLFANCMDNTIYSYNLCSYSSKPLAGYKGLLNSTFYIKSCLSPDGKYLLSGSSDEKAYIWNLNYPDEPLVALWGHTVEVTCVAWGSTHDCPIVTCSDDARHKIWRIGPENISDFDNVELYRGHAEYVRQFGRRAHGSTHKYNLRDLENTPRSLKRIMEQNERTPSSVEKVTAKRSFLEMLGGVAGEDDGEVYEPKRPKPLESRGRRLFSPSTSNVGNSLSLTSPQTRHINLQLIPIPEEPYTSPTSSTTNYAAHTHSNDSNQENTVETATPYISLKQTCPTIQSPLGERVVTENHNSDYTSPTNAGTSNNSTSQQPPLSSMIFSPTSNLPNYVLNGEAPHLGIMSPKRKHKEKIDWLTKIRKQKLMSSRNATLTEKIIEDCNGSQSPIASTSSRLQSLRTTEASPHSNVTPRRRKSSGTRDILSHDSPSTSRHLVSHPPKTPTSSRRNSETTILRFFSVRTQQRSDTTEFTSPAVETTEILGDLQPLTLTSAGTSTIGIVNRSIAYNTSTHTQATTICNE